MSNSDDIVERKQEWWSMDTVERATYVDDLIAEIERLRAVQRHLAEDVTAKADEIERLRLVSLGRDPQRCGLHDPA